MKFPAYIPESIRQFVLTQVKRVEELYKEGIIEEIAEDEWDRVTKQREERINLLVNDIRMQEVYSLLTSVFTKDEEFESFVRSAIHALDDYQKHSERMRRAKELKEETAEYARNLANKLAKLHDILREVNMEEGYHLNKTRNFIGASRFQDDEPIEMPETNELYHPRKNEWWDFAKVGILGLARVENTDEESYPMCRNYESTPIGIENLEKDKFIDGIRFAWQKAPPLTDCLKSFAEALESYELTYDWSNPHITAATSSRKRTVHVDYIRGFVALLLQYEVKITKPIMQAMAITANVVIDNPEIDVDYREVKRLVDSMKDSKPK